MPENRNLRAELWRWFFSLLVLIPLFVTPGIARKIQVANDLGRTIGFSWIFSFLDSLLLVACLLIALLLWHFPSMAFPGRHSSARRNAEYGGFVAVLVAMFLPFTLSIIWGSECMYYDRYQIDAESGYWGEPLCMPERDVRQYLPYSEYLLQLIIAFYGLLAVRMIFRGIRCWRARPVLGSGRSRPPDAVPVPARRLGS